MATTTQHYHTIRAHNFMIYTFYDSSVSFPFVSSRFGFAGSIPSGCELVWEEHFRQEHFGGERRRRSYCTPSPVSTSEPASQPASPRQSEPSHQADSTYFGANLVVRVRHSTSYPERNIQRMNAHSSVTVERPKWPLRMRLTLAHIGADIVQPTTASHTLGQMEALSGLEVVQKQTEKIARDNKIVGKLWGRRRRRRREGRRSRRRKICLAFCCKFTTFTIQSTQQLFGPDQMKESEIERGRDRQRSQLQNTS